MVGDAVRWQVTGDEGSIERVDERRNLFYRQDELRTKSFAANLDQVLVLVAADPEFSERQLTRALIAAQAERIDALIGRLVELAPEAAIVVTADHGMRDKPQITDLRPCVEAFDGRVVPVIKDPYTLHHGNLGGAVYVHLERGDRAAEASTELLEMRGVDRVLTADEAHDEFALHADRVGHLVVLGDADTVFSYGEPARSSDALRSHGSLHERAVPVITTNLEPISAEYSWEVTAAAFEMTR